MSSVVTREELIEAGLLIPASFYLGLSKDDPRRVKWELKLIKLGIDPQER